MKHSAYETIIEKQFNRSDFHRTYQDLKENDPESADLMMQVYMYFKKRLEFTSNENEAWNRLHWVINQGKASPLARNNIFKAAHALGMKLPSHFFASKAKTSGMDSQLEKYLLHGGKTPEPDKAEKIQESLDLFNKYGWKVRKIFRLGSLLYTRFEYKDGYETDIPESILEQPSRVKQEFLPALMKTYDMVSRWSLGEPMSYKRLLQYVEAKGFRRPASEYAYLAAAEYLKGKGFEFFHDFKTASQLEQEWGSTLGKQAAGERLLAVNHYSTTWDDMAQDDFFTANLFLGMGGKLRLYVTHRSKGLYTGDHTKVLEDLNVGTLQKPQLATIRSAVAKHNGYKYNKFSKDWYRVDSAGKWTTRAPLSVILAEVAGELDASLDPKKVDGMRAAIMQKLDRMKPSQVEAVFNSIMKM